jgi:Histidine phosphatase superfamily (branch 1)
LITDARHAPRTQVLRAEGGLGEVDFDCINLCGRAGRLRLHRERQQAVILVRHAELQGAAMAPAKDLQLSDAGDARAKRLSSMLTDAGVGAIYVTDFVRTSKTAEVLSRALIRKSPSFRKAILGSWSSACAVQAMVGRQC